MKKRYLMSGIVAILWIGLLNQSLSGKDGNLAMIFMVDGEVHQEMELYKAFKEHVEWRKEAGDPWSWQIWKVVVGENMGRYIIRSGNHTLEDLDAYGEFLSRGHVEWVKHVMPYIAAEWSFITMGDKEIVNWPEGKEVNYLSVSEFEMKPGEFYKFRNAVKTFHDTIVENDYPGYYALDTIFSGRNGEFAYLVHPAESYADLSEPEENIWDFMVRIHGEEKAGNLFGTFNSTYIRNSKFILKLIPELSIDGKM